MPDDFEPPPDRVRLAGRLADEARAYLRDAFPRRGEVEIKSDGTPVTPFDRGLEERLREILAREAPEDGVLGEEYGSDRADAEFVWILDPIDGTKAFLTGKPTFGSLIGLAHRGSFSLGIIECPALEERWVGGVGLPTTRNGEPARVRPGRALADCYAYAFNSFSLDARYRPGLDRVRRAVRFTVHDTDCFAYGLLASGEIDLVVEPELCVHDFAALVPIVRSAGGVIESLSGDPLTTGAAADVLAASSARVAEAARAAYGPVT